MGVPYHVRVYAHNQMGYSPISAALSAVPRQIPSAPSDVSLAVVSGTDIEVFFSKPALPSDSVAAGYEDDITSYDIQYDTKYKVARSPPVPHYTWACACNI